MRVIRKARNVSCREAILQCKAQSRLMASGDWLTWRQINTLLAGAAKGLTHSPFKSHLDGAIFSIS